MKTTLPLTFVVASVTMLRAAAIYSPSEGFINDASAIPFLTITNQTDSVRYQQVYGASDFAGEGSPQFEITEIAFVGGPGSPIDVVLQNVQIYLSTTSRAVDSLSPVFGDNLGPDTLLVFSGQLHLRPQGTSPYAFQIPLENPFLYDWSRGNLLLDVRNYQTVPPLPEGYPPRFLTTMNTLGDTVSSIAAFGVNSPTARFGDTTGLLTRFTVTGVPEPSTVWLLLAGLGALSLVKSRRHRSPAQANPDPAELR